MLTPGTRLDRYELLAPLGEGGQGSVWRVRDPLDPTAARAVKLVRLALSRPTDAERVRREARALARLRHPSLVRCHALFEDLSHEVIGLVLDHVDGLTLAEALRAGRLTQGSIGLVLRHVAHALAYVHGQGLAHRDLKLTNVVLAHTFFQRPEDPSTVKLLDFGIAAVEGDADRLTALGALIGTPAYLAPELLDPKAFGSGAPLATADVFGFGVLGHRLLTGQHPTGLDPQASTVDFATAYREARARGGVFPPTPAPGPFSAVLGECLALDPVDRIPHGEALARRCDAALGPALEPVREAEAALAREATANPPPVAPTSGPTVAVGPTHTTPAPPAPAVPQAAGPLAPTPGPAVAPPPGTPAALGDPRTLSSVAHAGGAPTHAAEGGSSGAGWMLTGVVVLVGGLAAVLWAAGALRGPEPPPPLDRPPSARAGAAATAPPPRPARSAPSAPSGSASAAPAASSSAPVASAEPPASAAPDASTAPDSGAAADAGAAPSGDRPPGCATDAPLCTCCGTGLACGGPCAEALPAELAVWVRPIALLSGETDLLRQQPDFQVCLRLDGEPVAPWVCTTAADIPGDPLPPPFLSTSVGELTRRGLDVEVRGTGGIVMSQGTGLAVRAETRLSRCQGVRVSGLGGALAAEALVLALDVPGRGAPRCSRGGERP